MKLRHRFLFATDLMFERKLHLVLVVIILACSFFMTTLTTALMNKSGEELRQYEQLYKGSIDNVCQLQINTVGSMMMEESHIDDFFATLEDLPGVKTVGYFMDYDAGIVESKFNYEMADIVYKHQPNTFYDVLVRNNSKLVFSNKEMTDFILDDPLFEKVYDNSTNYVLVGEAFKELFAIGDVLHFSDIELTVAGYIPLGTIWPAEGFSQAVYNQSLDLGYHFFTSQRILADFGGALPFVNAMYIILESPDVYDAVAQQIHDNAEKNDVGVSLIPIKQSLKNVYKEYYAVRNMYMKFLIFLWIISLMTAVMSALISVMLDRRKVGIWLSSGILLGDVFSFVVFEQLGMILLASALAFSAGMLFCQLFAKMYLDIFIQTSAVYMTSLALLSLLLMSTVPILYLRRQKITELQNVKD